MTHPTDQEIISGGITLVLSLSIYIPAFYYYLSRTEESKWRWGLCALFTLIGFLLCYFFQPITKEGYVNLLGIVGAVLLFSTFFITILDSTSSSRINLSKLKTYQILSKELQLKMVGSNPEEYKKTPPHLFNFNLSGLIQQKWFVVITEHMERINTLNNEYKTRWHKKYEITKIKNRTDQWIIRKNNNETMTTHLQKILTGNKDFDATIEIYCNQENQNQKAFHNNEIQQLLLDHAHFFHKPFYFNHKAQTAEWIIYPWSSLTQKMKRENNTFINQTVIENMKTTFHMINEILVRIDP